VVKQVVIGGNLTRRLKGYLYSDATNYCPDVTQHKSGTRLEQGKNKQI